MSKKLVGGDFLLDLSSIELAESVDGETYTNITDKAILEQLTNLKNYVKNPQMIKPIWVKLINGETDELVVVRGSLAQVDDGEFDIVVNLDGYKLKIHVEFTQATLSDSTPIDDWYIDTNDAKYLLTSDEQALAGQLSDFTGDVAITGDLSVSGKINNENNPSVKPIYYHPIYFVLSLNSTNKLCMQCAILDNNPTAYTATTFVQKIKDLMNNGAIINVNGWFRDADDVFNDIIVLYYAGGNYTADIFNPTGYSDFNFGALLDAEGVTITCVDGVNKIN